MAGSVPSLREIEETIERMEARYREDPLYEDYERLKRRFETDLIDARDRALSQAAALMLIKFKSGD